MDLSDESQLSPIPIANVAAGTSLPRDPPAYPYSRKLSWRPEVTGLTPDHEGARPSFSSLTWKVLDTEQGTSLLLENVKERHGLQLKDGEGASENLTDS